MTPSSLLRNLGRGAVERYHAFDNRHPKVRTGPADQARTIYYLTPHNPEPAGGVRVMYRHVDILNEQGIDAAVLHGKRGFRCTWFEHDTRVVDTSSVRVSTNDILVVPEIHAGLLPELPRGVRHVIFNQGPHLTFHRDTEIVVEHYASSPDLAGVLTVSEHGRGLLEYAFPHLDVKRVRLGLDRTLFHPSDGPGRRRIMYMPRRGAADAKLAIELLKGRGVLEGWEICSLNGLSHQQIADELRQGSIFLHFAHQEGFGLPAAEAMACGNLVIGFHGFGGREVFRPKLSRPVPTGDVVALAQTVEEVLAREADEPGWCRRMGLAASDFVLDEYSAQHEREDVVGFYQDLLGRGSDGDVKPEPVNPIETVC